jgi:hypothetical protein
MTADPMHLELAPGVFVERIVFSSTIETGRKRSLLGVVASWRQKKIRVASWRPSEPVATGDVLAAG